MICEGSELKVTFEQLIIISFEFIAALTECLTLVLRILGLGQNVYILFFL